MKISCRFPRNELMPPAAAAPAARHHKATIADAHSESEHVEPPSTGKFSAKAAQAGTPLPRPFPFSLILD